MEWSAHYSLAGLRTGVGHYCECGWQMAHDQVDQLRFWEIVVHQRHGPDGLGSESLNDERIWTR